MNNGPPSKKVFIPGADEAIGHVPKIRQKTWLTTETWSWSDERKELRVLLMAISVRWVWYIEAPLSVKKYEKFSVTHAGTKRIRPLYSFEKDKLLQILPNNLQVAVMMMTLWKVGRFLIRNVASPAGSCINVKFWRIWSPERRVVLVIDSFSFDYQSLCQCCLVGRTSCVSMNDVIIPQVFKDID